MPAVLAAGCLVFVCDANDLSVPDTHGIGHVHGRGNLKQHFGGSFVGKK